MIENEEQLQTTENFLGQLESALERMRRLLLPAFPERYEILAQCYVEEIERVRNEISSYKKKSACEIF